jgi:hypothetical protein
MISTSLRRDRGRDDCGVAMRVVDSLRRSTTRTGTLVSEGVKKHIACLFSQGFSVCCYVPLLARPGVSSYWIFLMGLMWANVRRLQELVVALQV